jgi:PAS domain S-box-containing protein
MFPYLIICKLLNSHKKINFLASLIVAIVIVKLVAMSFIPRIAIFNPTPELVNSFKQLFNYDHYSVRWVNSEREIIELTKEETQPFDVIIIPSKLDSGVNCSGQCMLCKAEALITHIPLVVLSDNTDPSIISNMFASGADVILHLPCNKDFLYNQISALARMSKNFMERSNATLSEASLRHPIVKAFHAIREGFILVDAQGTVIFYNRALSKMLGIKSLNTDLIIEKLNSQLSALIKEHNAKVALSSQSSDSFVYSSYEYKLEQTNGSQLDCQINVTAIFWESHQLLGYAIAISDLSEVQHLGNLLATGQRIRSLMLVIASACQALIYEKTGERPLAPYEVVKNYLADQPHYTEVSSTLNDLLDTLDLTINPNISIQVHNDYKDAHVSIAHSDLFVMLGHVIFTAIEHVGTNGDISIYCQKQNHDQSMAIIISAEARNLSAFYADDSIGKLIHNDLSDVKSLEQLSANNNLGLGIAQNIAETYNTSIAYQVNGTTLGLRILLPIVQNKK